MSESIRIVSSTSHSDVVQVYDHQVLVKIVNGGFECECWTVSTIGNVLCALDTSVMCWHVHAAVNHLLEQKGMGAEWYSDEGDALWNWGTRLDNRKWAVRSKTGVAWVIAREAETIAIR